MTNEPVITINGQPCNLGEASTIRVAIESFSIDLVAKGLGDDDHGKKMTAHYMASIEKIRDKMYHD